MSKTEEHHQDKAEEASISTTNQERGELKSGLKLEEKDIPKFAHSSGFYDVWRVLLLLVGVHRLRVLAQVVETRELLAAVTRERPLPCDSVPCVSKVYGDGA